MKPIFHTQYRPLTSRPFLYRHTYAEYAPCGQLAPYIACFWEVGSTGVPLDPANQEVRVIPDTCVDIIMEIDYGIRSIKSRIYGLADSPAIIKQEPVSRMVTTFADQPHLLNEFKRFHGVTPQQAKEIALMSR